MNPYGNFTYDDALSLKDAGLVATTTTESTIVDLGEGLFDGYLVLEVTAVEVATGDEIYDVCLEGSTVSGMASGSVCLSRIKLGNAPAPADADTDVGRFVVPVRNEQNGTLYRYVRIYTAVAGTVATGINFSAFLAKD
ncbi:MAG: hypothetical protein IPJ61_18620 [Tessaracoccus sp.]|uniref:hypothetical protein n=1 Tax=Tessaracoccus sp. TaxID=1971211 RepID=UPI001EBC6782|nr:hypothetical protein [Tessaracoccus sp.]MBK7822999.1 hypothetical protein [Tessaracoccus sp.]